jgi:hypothetical protein
MTHPGVPPVTLTGDTIRLKELAITHGEAAAIARGYLDSHGPDALADLIRRALPVGLVALSMGHAAVDTGAISRTLDAFADQVEARSKETVEGLEQTLARLRTGEQAVAQTTQDVLSRLPAQVEAALGGQAGHIRASVAEATRAVQATGMQEVRAALTQHAESVRNALSLDRDGPVQALRKDLLDQLDGTRRELAEQLTHVRGLLQAAEAQKAGAAKSTRAIGLEWEAIAMAIADEVITAAGDRFEATGARPAPGGTSRAGDGVATLSPAITGHGRQVRIVVEAKKRSRPMSAKQLRDELAGSRGVRDAVAGLVLVPTPEEVPGGSRFARVDDLAFVVAADDPTVVSLVYLILREMTALLTVRQSDGDEIDLAKVEAQLGLALTALAELDEVGRLAGQAEKTLQNLRAVGGRVQKKIHEALTNGLAVLHP